MVFPVVLPPKIFSVSRSHVAIVALVSTSMCAGCAPLSPDLPEVGSTCGVGERASLVDGALTCSAAPYLSINIDERLDESVDVRRGIGVNACIYRASDLAPQREEGACAVFAYAGQSAIESTSASTGGIAIDLDAPILLSKAPDGDCFSNNLDRDRNDLFAPGELFDVEGLGGGDLAPFLTSIEGPSDLAIASPSSTVDGDDVVIRWESDVDFPGDRILIAIRASNVSDDTASHIACAIEDADGEVRISGALTRHLVDDSAWQLFAMRQRWVHLEARDTALAVDIFATTSVVRSISVTDGAN